MRDLAFLLAWLGMLVPVLVAGAHAAVLLWVWTSLLAPNDVLYGFVTGIPFSKLAVVIAVPLLLIGRGGGIRFGWNGTVALLVMLGCTAVVSQSMALSSDAVGGWDLCQKLIKILALAVVVTGVMRDRLRVHALLIAMSLGIGFTGVDEGLKWLASGGGHQMLGSPSVGDNNQIGMDVLLIVPLLAHVHGVASRRLVRVACVIGGLLCAICAIGSNSRGAFVGLVVLGLGLAMTGRRKLPALLLVGLLALVGSQLLPSSWFERMDSIKTAKSDDSFEGRVVAWKMSILVAMHRPLFGGGMHAIQEFDVWDRYKPEFDRVSFIPSPDPLNAHAAHSIYFELLGDLGVCGLGSFLGLVALALVNGRAVRRAVRQSARPDLLWAADLARKVELSLVVFLVSGSALSAAYYDIDYLLIVLMTVLRDLVRRELGGVEVPAGRLAPLRIPVPALASVERPGSR